MRFLMLFRHYIVVVETSLTIVALIIASCCNLNLSICWWLGLAISLLNDNSWLSVCWLLLDDDCRLTIGWLAIGRSSIVASVYLLVTLVTVTLIIALVVHNIYYKLSI